eukprot:4346212-Pyramimonas_sp.AAC.1
MLSQRRYQMVTLVDASNQIVYALQTSVPRVHRIGVADSTQAISTLRQCRRESVCVAPHKPD